LSGKNQQVLFSQRNVDGHSPAFGRGQENNEYPTGNSENSGWIKFSRDSGIEITQEWQSWLPPVLLFPHFVIGHF
jgi:hypothetical protein